MSEHIASLDPVFGEIIASLGAARPTVGWSNGWRANQAAADVLASDAADDSDEVAGVLHYLETCFPRVMSIFMEQQPYRLGQNEKECVERAVRTSLPLVLAAVRRGHLRYLEQLALVFNRRNPFYRGIRTFMTSAPGLPEVRNRALAAFAADGGFAALAAALDGREEDVDLDTLRLLVQAAGDCRSPLPAEVSKGVCRPAVRRLRNLTDEELKAASTDTIGALMTQLQRLMGDAIFAFWLELTLKYLTSGSLPQRLFGMEQLAEVIGTVEAARAPPEQYVVSGAGSPDVNGVYDLVLDPNEDDPKYVRGDFTIFRCPMQSKAKWWFLSVCDPDMPGSEKDVDYYQHNSAASDTLPPRAGWLALPSRLEGADPAPAMRPLRSPDAAPSPNESLLLRWIEQNNIVESVFGSNIHREVVNRAARLFSFLATANELQPEHLTLAWQSGAGQEEALVEELHTLLANAAPDLPEALLVHLLQTAAEDAATATDTLAFADRLAAASGGAVLGQGPAVVVAVLQLLWALQQNPNSKAASPELVTFFHDALRAEGAAEQRAAFLEQCVETLRASADAATGGDEKAVGRALELLQFVIETFDAADAVVDRLAAERDLVGLLFRELHAAAAREGADTGARLQVIRYVHCKSPSVNLSMDQLRQLWGALREAEADRERFFVFLREASSEGSFGEGADALAVQEQVFAELLCAESTGPLGTEGFRCFQSYFAALNSSSDTVVGLDALWRIALRAAEGSDEAGEAAALLRDLYKRPDAAKQTNYFDRVFAAMAPDTLARCATLLNNLVDLDPARRVGVPHGGRCRGAPVTLNVTARAIRYAATAYCCATCGYRAFCTACIAAGRRPARALKPETLGEGEMQTHSKDTVRSLKARLAAEWEVDPACVKLFLRGQALLQPQRTLDSYQVSPEGDAVAVVVFPLPVDSASTSGAGAGAADSDEPHPADQLALRTDRLFEVLDAVPAADAATVWALLAALPTNADLEARVRAAGASGDWDGLLPAAGAAHSHRAVYVMQIVDALLHPAHATEGHDAEEWRNAFIATGGLARVLAFFLQADGSAGQAVALRIVKFCPKPVDLDLPAFVGKLVEVAVADDDDDVVLDALLTLSDVLPGLDATALDALVASPGFAAFSTGILLAADAEPAVRAQSARTLLGMCERSPAALTAVFDHLAAALPELPTDQPSADFFELLGRVVKLGGDFDAAGLLRTLTTRLLALQRPTDLLQLDTMAPDEMLEGMLRTLATLLEARPGELLPLLGDDFAGRVFDEFLFALPSLADKTNYPLCQPDATRRAAFDLLATLAATDAAQRDGVMGLVTTFMDDAGDALAASRGQFYDVDTKTSHVGLVNQGCTCYINSLVQQLFMMPSFREAVLAARTVGPEQWLEAEDEDLAPLVGQRLALQWASGKAFAATLTAFDGTMGDATLAYDEGSGADEAAPVVVRLDLGGRRGKETGRFRLLKPGETEPAEEDSTKLVLQQLQRCFRFLSDSKMRAYNPRGFIEACRCLNLNYDVYQQNDAAEFADQLLDRLEMGLKGQAAAQGMAECFGGQQLAQKIPKECDHRADRAEPFLRVELIIRGKESIHESLDAFVEGELMCGDNKVECEACNEKKDMIRRTCFGHLPNTLILHLKRFDLDFTTFETVKLNNRCAFPIDLNMRQYTKVGIEERERLEEEAAEQGVDPAVYLAEHAPSDEELAHYAYRLKGVLVHSGVAQGGHYYSFIQDRQGGNWFRFDDDQVSAFDAADIEEECFGGKQVKTSMGHTYEMDVFNNALMLFYERVEPQPLPESPKDDNNNAGEPETETEPEAQTEAQTEQKEEQDGPNGGDEFEKEVWTTNNQFLCRTYIQDESFQTFLLSVLERETEGDARVTQLGLRMLLDVTLQARDKSTAHAWLQALCARLEASREAREWLADQLLTAKQGAWLRRLLLEIADTPARGHFARLVSTLVVLLAKDEAAQVAAAAAAAHERGDEAHAAAEEAAAAAPPLGPNATAAQVAAAAYRVGGSAAPAAAAVRAAAEAATGAAGSRTLKLLSAVLLLLKSVPSFRKRAEELFGALRDMAAGDEALRDLMCALDVPAQLANVLLQTQSPFALRALYGNVPSLAAQYTPPDFGTLVEAVAACAGLEVARRADLLTLPADGSRSLMPVLSEPAAAAAAWVYAKYAPPGSNGDKPWRAQGLSGYVAAVGLTGQAAAARMRQLLHYAGADGALSLAQFLTACRDSARLSPKTLLGDLRAHGVREDLRVPQEGEPAAVETAAIPERVRLSATTRWALQEGAFVGAVLGEAAMVVPALVLALCRGNAASTADVLAGVARVLVTTQAWKPVPPTVTDVLAALLAPEDEAAAQAAQAALFDAHTGLFPLAQARARAWKAHPSNHEHPQIACRLLATATALSRLPTVRAALAAAPDAWDWAHDWLMSASLTPTLGGQGNVLRAADKVAVLDVMAELLGRPPVPTDELTYEVTGAGCADVNGEYTQNGTHDEAPKFERVSDATRRTYTLFRCVVGQNRKWFITVGPEGGQLGTKHDVDFYQTAATTAALPPQQGWAPCAKNQEAVRPPPVVRAGFTQGVAPPTAPVQPRPALDYGDSDSDSDSESQDGDEDDIMSVS